MTTGNRIIRTLAPVFALFLMMLVVHRPSHAQSTDADREAVRQAVQDYVDALYDVNPSLIERSVHPRMAKMGAVRRPGSSVVNFAPMSYRQLVDLARTWNADDRQNLGPNPLREITVFDVLDTTASAKLVAFWGVDHMHLVKEDGAWKIINVLWQFPPTS